MISHELKLRVQPLQKQREDKHFNQFEPASSKEPFIEEIFLTAVFPPPSLRHTLCNELTHCLFHSLRAPYSYQLEEQIPSCTLTVAPWSLRICPFLWVNSGAACLRPTASSRCAVVTQVPLKHRHLAVLPTGETAGGKLRTLWQIVFSYFPSHWFTPSPLIPLIRFSHLVTHSEQKAFSSASRGG